MAQDRRPPCLQRESERTSTAGRWIVCERSGRWARALRREAGPAGPRLVETRSLFDAWMMLEQHPASFLVAELTVGNAEALVEHMAQLHRLYPQARIAVVADRALADWEWLAREAGAIWFAASPREVQPVVAIARRHLRLVSAAGGDFVEEMWQRLPWKPISEA